MLFLSGKNDFKITGVIVKGMCVLYYYDEFLNEIFYNSRIAFPSEGGVRGVGGVEN